MSDVIVSYKGQNIINVSDTSTKTLKTSGKYCEGDITINYTKPVTFNSSIKVFGAKQTDTVVATKGSKTKTGVWTSRLPAEYQEVEYLKSTGSQYILTDITEDYFDLDISYTIDGTGNYFVFGGAKYHVWKESDGYKTLVGYSNQFIPSDGYISTAGQRIDLSAKLRGTTSTVTINDNIYTKTINTALSNPSKIEIFSASYSSGYAYKGKIYKILLADPNTSQKIAEFVPCYLKSDTTKHTAGMYDLVSQTFFPNAGTGYFEVGADVDNGYFLIDNIDEAGTWTVTGTRSGISASTNVLIDVEGSYEVTIYIPNVPSEYQELSYIESTGTQWIDTGIAYNENNLRFKIKAVNTEGCLGTNAWVGSLSSKQYQDKKTHRYNFSESGLPRVYELKSDGFYVDGISASGSSDSGQNVTTNMRLFFTVNTPRTSRIYYLQISNGSAEGNFIPCYRKSDGEVGMYDTVSQTFFTNQGTGSFKMGAVIDNDFNSTYQQVEYLGSSGSQCINTNISLNNATKIRIKSIVTPKYFSGYDGQFPFDYLYFDSQGSHKLKAYAEGNTIVDSYTRDTEYNLDYTITLTSFDIWYNSGHSSGSITRLTTNSNICIFKYFNFPSSYFWKGDISTTVYLLDDQIAGIFIPCYRISDNVAGMYDMVNKVFYTNAGSGVFTVGADIDIEEVA